MTANSNFLKILDEQIKQRSEELGQLLNEREILGSKVSEAQRWLERAKALRETEAMKTVGVKSIQATMAKSHRFFGMWPRDACHLVLRERKRMTKEELVEELKQGGFDFRGANSPLRVVNFALVNDPKVKMYANGFVEWIGESAN